MLGDVIDRDGNIRGWEERIQTALPNMAKSAYDKLIDGIDLEESKVILSQVKTQIYLGERRTGDGGFIWEWEVCKSSYLPGQLVGECTSTFVVVLGSLSKITRTCPPHDVALHRKIVGLPRQA